MTNVERATPAEIPIENDDSDSQNSHLNNESNEMQIELPGDLKLFKFNFQLRVKYSRCF